MTVKLPPPNVCRQEYQSTGKKPSMTEEFVNYPRIKDSMGGLHEELSEIPTQDLPELNR